MFIEQRQQLSLRKLAPFVFRSLDIEAQTGEVSIHKLPWRDLSSLQSDIVKNGRVMIDRVSDGVSETESRAVDEAWEALMEIHGAIDGEKNIRSALGDKGPRATSGNPRKPLPGDQGGEARGMDGYIDDEDYHANHGGGSADEPQPAFALRSGETFAQRISTRSKQRGGGNTSEYRSLGEGGYLRAMVLGPKTGLEKRALSEGTDSAGGYTVPDFLAARMIDRLRAKLVLGKLGAQTVPLFSDKNVVARIATDPTPAWRLENQAVAESEPTFDSVQLIPRSLMVLVKVSRELLEDSINIETALPDVIAAAMAAEVDRVGLLGTGTAPQPRGVKNFTGLTANPFVAGQLGYGSLISARTALRSANSDVTGYVMHPRDEGWLAGLQDTQLNFIVPPVAIASIPMLTTTVIPTNLGSGTNESFVIAGDWSKLLIGIRSELRIEILRERFADLHQYGFVAHLRVDIAAEQEKAFTVLSGTKVV